MPVPVPVPWGGGHSKFFCRLRFCCCATLQQASQGYGHYGLIWILGLLVLRLGGLFEVFGVFNLSFTLSETAL